LVFGAHHNFLLLDKMVANLAVAVADHQQPLPVAFAEDLVQEDV